MKFPEDCLVSTRFAVPKHMKDHLRDPNEMIQYERRERGRELGRQLAERFEWSVQSYGGNAPELHSLNAPEVHSLSLIVLTPDQLVDIILQAKQEGREQWQKVAREGSCG